MLLINISILSINESFEFERFRILKERTGMNYQTMHDLRNYLYSLKDETSDIEDSTQDHKPYFKSNNAHERRESLSLATPQSYLDQSYKFIIFKITYLYHLDLIFNYDYKIKIGDINTTHLAEEAIDQMNILFQNKTSKIQFSLKKSNMKIKLDKNIYIYLLYEFINQINKMKITQFIVNLDFYTYEQYYIIEFKVHLKLNKYLINYLINLYEKSVISFLAGNLNHDSKYTFYLDENSNELIYRIVYYENPNTEYNKTMLKKLNYTEFSNKNRNSYPNLYEYNCCYGNNNLLDSILYDKEYYYLKISNMQVTSTPRNYLIMQSKSFNLDGITDISEVQNNESNNNNLDYEDVDSNFSFNADHTDKNKVEVNVDYDYVKYLKPDYSKLKLRVQVSYETQQSNGTIFINIDDESNTLKMNMKIFNKHNIFLNICSTCEEYLYMIGYIYNNFINTMSNSKKNIEEGENDIEIGKPNVVVLVDHILDRDYGYDVVKYSNFFNEYMNLGMDFTYILLSSSEEQDTNVKYQDLGIEHLVVKPFTYSKLDEMKKFLTKKNRFGKNYEFELNNLD